MISVIENRLKNLKGDGSLYLFSFLLLISILLSIGFESVLPLAITPGYLLLHLTIRSPKWLYFLTVLTIPYVVEVDLMGGFATDLPTEPLALLCMISFAGLLFVNKGKILHNDWSHPLVLVLLLQLFWTFFTSIFASYPFVAIKFSLAKVWFLSAFVFMPLYVIKDTKDIDTLFKLLFLGLLPAMLTTFVRNGMDGFVFEGVNSNMYPFFRNKVFYSSILLFCIPLGIYLINYVFKSRFSKIISILIIAVYIAGIMTAYTRATLALLFIIPFVHLAFKWRLVKVSLVAVVVFATIFVVGIVRENNFLNYAPDFETTISHSNFGNLLEATTEGRDISTMERVYRWVAGGYMVKERPLLGFGPSNFYHNYQGYALNIFSTYVSDNPEKSGIHSYYLMMAVEQGIPGLIIFISIIFIFFIRAERLYNKLPAGKMRGILMSICIIFIFFTILQTINDMIEAYKVGFFYYLCLMVLIVLERIEKEKSRIDE